VDKINNFWKTVENELEKIDSSLTELSRAVFLPKNTIFSWRNNDRIPPSDKGLLIADYLNSDLQYLLTGGRQGLSKEQARWKSWVDSSSDNELEHARNVLAAAEDFNAKINIKSYSHPDSKVKKIQAAENSQGSYKGNKSK